MNTKQEICVRIRGMTHHDMDEVIAIENDSFEFPWLEGDFRLYLRKSDCMGVVAEYGDQIVGFMVYKLYKNQIDLLNFAVHPEFRRRGVGTQMIAKLMGRLLFGERIRILFEIRETNMDGLIFFRERGFKAVEILRDFYRDTPEDAYLMEYRRKDGRLANVVNRIAGWVN